MTLQAKVLTVSDGVMAGTREDRSGAALVETLTAAGFEVVETRVIADGVASVAGALSRLAGTSPGWWSPPAAPGSVPATRRPKAPGR